MMEEVLSQVFGIWFLIGAALVFFMQAGFAVVEAGFTRAKNAGNIIMKNTMDFCLGTVAFSDFRIQPALRNGRKSLDWLGRPSADGFRDHRLVDVYLQPCILRHGRHDRFRRDGGTNEVYFLLRVLVCDQLAHLSNRGPLGMGTGRIFDRDGIPRFRGIGRYSLRGRDLRLHRRGDAGRQNWQV